MLKKLPWKSYLPIFFEIVVIVGMFFGVFYSAGGDDFMGSGTTFLFFTIQSNLTIAAICLVYMIIHIIGLSRNKEIVIPKWLDILKFLFTVAITLTFLVFMFMLMPQMIASGQSAYLATPSNIFCHNLVPIFALLDWFICDSKRYNFKTKDMFWGIAMPIYYLVFSMLFSLSGIRYGMDGSTMPYFFLDYEKNGWFSIGGGKFGVVYWIIIVVGIVIGISAVLNVCNKKIHNRFYAEKIAVAEGDGEVVVDEVNAQEQVTEAEEQKDTQGDTE